jgi:hypothetical protein
MPLTRSPRRPGDDDQALNMPAPVGSFGGRSPELPSAYTRN